VDALTMKMVSTCFQMHELSKEKIMLVELVDKPRHEYPNSEAIYFLTPTQSSVELMLKDFTLSTSIYKAAHIYFTQTIPDTLFKMMADSEAVTWFKSLKEVNMSLIPLESQIYSIDMVDCVSTYFNEGDESRKRATMERMAEQVASMCATLDEYPAIRYREDHEDNGDLAQLVQAKLDKLKALEPNLGQATSKSQLIILDRGFDPSSPLLHELTLQAMAKDLLDIEGNVYKYEGNQGEKKIVLDERNQLWTELRHKHIAKVIEIITNKQKELKKYEDQVKESDMRGMKSDIKKLPKHEQDKAQITALFDLVSQCMEKNNNNLCEVEQAFATGTDEEGCTIKNPMGSIVRTLLDPNISIENKIRIILLYIISKDGISQDDLTKMIQHGKIPPRNADAIRNLASLGVNVVLEPGHTPSWKLKRKTRSSQYNTSRWTPIMKDIIEQAMEDRLDTNHFPFLRSGQIPCNTSSARQYGQWGRSQGRGKPRLLVFVVGGVCHSEMRTAYELTQEKPDWEVVVGGSHVLNPDGFLKNLACIGGDSCSWEEQEKEPLLK